MLYRSFTCVHARLLLNLQYDIQSLETELDELDVLHDSTPDQQPRLAFRDKDIYQCKQEQTSDQRSRADILEDLLHKVSQYGS